MNIIYKKRKSGKTEELIKRSSENNGYIVCTSHSDAEYIFSRASELNYNINFPITYNVFLNKRYYGKGIKCFLMDNVDLFIEELSNVPVSDITLTNRTDDYLNLD